MKYLKYMLPVMILSLSVLVFSDGKKVSYMHYVNPFIGTNDMGHCFPGAAVPFGMVQLSPDTGDAYYSYGDGYNRDVYRYCSGYQYTDTSILGFSHTHFNGTGHSDLGDIRIMPATGVIQMTPGSKDNPDSGYRSRFSHDNESAEPGYYRVLLTDSDILAELTATMHTGIHRYTFPKGVPSPHIILDLTSGIYNYDGKVVWASVRMESPTLLTGVRQTNGWARDRQLFFVIEFSQPVTSYRLLNEAKEVYRGFWRQWNMDSDFPERSGEKIKGCFNFELLENREIIVKIGLSSVSTEGALKNLRAETNGKDFNSLKIEAQQTWEKQLSKIRVKGDKNTLINFYTAMYHSVLNPVVFSDVDGSYRGLDRNVHKPTGREQQYTVFSLWDTFRALHPLMTIVEPDRTGDMIQSMLNHYDQSVHHILPVWSHFGNENWCMIGYHAVPVISDAFLKGIRNYNVEKAFEAVLKSSTYEPYDGLRDYIALGYVAEDHTHDSASITLEYAYDDWTIYKMAKAMGKKHISEEYRQRAGNYSRLFDSNTGFIRARYSDGSWKTPFDPMSTSGQGYIEGNAWNYSLFVPHDPEGLMILLGGREKLVSWLDTLFSMEVSDDSIAGSEDIEKSGMIGNYVHGNEPSHHVPYLYVFAGKPWKTQEKVRHILNTMYRNKTDGLCGNDDCGQMSAWYIFSALGFYPVSPGSNQYILGSPAVSEAAIPLSNGNTFTITVDNMSEENIYVQSVTLNRKPLSRGYITHKDILNGGRLHFIMGDSPNKILGKHWDLPYSMSREDY